MVISYFRLPFGWFELLKRTVQAIITDNVLGLSAQLAFYFFLSLFPALLFLVALLSFLPIEGLMDELLLWLGQFAPPDVLDIIRDQLERLAGNGHSGLLTIGFLGAVWSSSLAMAGIIDALNRAYNIQESRPIWKVRPMAILLTVGLSAFVIVAIFLVLIGPQVAELLAVYFGFGRVFELTWKIVQWPLVVLLISTGIGLIYYFAPDAEQEWVWITPGSIVATFLWLLSSLGLRYYLVQFEDYEATYGTIGGVIVLMLWFYLTGMAILIGAEINSEIEHASPYGKDPGEKKPGEKKTIGAAAAKAYEERVSSGALETVPLTEEANCLIDTPPRRSRRAGLDEGPARSDD